MAVRKEWTEWHLTLRGWERGATRVHGRGNDWPPEPVDRVASWVYSETKTSAGLRRLAEPTWDNKILSLVNELMTRFGPCPKTL